MVAADNLGVELGIGDEQPLVNVVFLRDVRVLILTVANNTGSDSFWSSRFGSAAAATYLW